MPRYKSLEERLISNSVIDPETGCWNWTGKKKSDGYGHINLRMGGRHRTFKAHRIAYTEMKGHIPDGYEIDHTCYNPSCINPDHLEAVPPGENLARRRY